MDTITSKIVAAAYIGLAYGLLIGLPILFHAEVLGWGGTSPAGGFGEWMRDADWGWFTFSANWLG